MRAKRALRPTGRDRRASASHETTRSTRPRRRGRGERYPVGRLVAKRLGERCLEAAADGALAHADGGGWQGAHLLGEILRRGEQFLGRNVSSASVGAPPPTSAPEQNPRPAPVQMATQVSSSSWIWRQASRISAIIARLIAFRRSGRLSMTVATWLPGSRSKRGFSKVKCMPSVEGVGNVADPGRG